MVIVAVVPVSVAVVMDSGTALVRFSVSVTSLAETVVLSTPEPVSLSCTANWVCCWVVVTHVALGSMSLPASRSSPLSDLAA